MPPLRVIVMGGSLAGLASAVFLRRADVDVEVFERSQRPLVGRGAGIVLHPAVFRVLDRDPQEISARADVLRYLDRDGAIASEQPCSYRFISYAALHRAMLECLAPDTYHLGAEVTDFAQDAGGVTVEVAGHEAQRGDALVCADGIHSIARRRLVPDVQPVYAGYVGWRGTVVESRLSEEAFATFADAITYCVLPNSHILVYPIPSLAGSLEPGERLINWVWYRNASPRELDRLLVDRAGVRHAVSVGSGDVREDVLEGLLADAALRLPPQLAELVAKSPEPFVQVVFDIAVPHMAFERIALIGDAAFALRPHVAVGTAKAAEDAWTLAAALADADADGDVSHALRAWETDQIRLALSAMERARDAGARSQFDNSWRVGDPLPFGLYEAGDSLLARSG
jgi:2,6-dihydroxypyridine 3-monooxygenase